MTCLVGVGLVVLEVVVVVVSLLLITLRQLLYCLP